MMTGLMRNRFPSCSKCGGVAWRRLEHKELSGQRGYIDTYKCNSCGQEMSWGYQYPEQALR